MFYCEQWVVLRVMCNTVNRYAKSDKGRLITFYIKAKKWEFRVQWMPICHSCLVVDRCGLTCLLYETRCEMRLLVNLCVYSEHFNLDPHPGTLAKLADHPQFPTQISIISYHHWVIILLNSYLGEGPTQRSHTTE